MQTLLLCFALYLVGISSAALSRLLKFFTLPMHIFFIILLTSNTLRIFFTIIFTSNIWDLRYFGLLSTSLYSVTWDLMGPILNHYKVSQIGRLTWLLSLNRVSLWDVKMYQFLFRELKWQKVLYKVLHGTEKQSKYGKNQTVSKQTHRNLSNPDEFFTVIRDIVLQSSYYRCYTSKKSKKSNLNYNVLKKSQ